MHNIFSRIVFGVFIFCRLFLFSYGLYEDQAGKFDWYQQFIGKVDKFYIENYNAPSRRIIISSNNNVHSALNLVSGKIEWRQCLKEGEVVKSIDYCKNSLSSVSIFSGGTILRVWDTVIGVVQWEKQILERHAAIAFLKCNLNTNSIIVNVDDTVFSYSIKSGKLIWQSKINISNDIQESSLYTTKSNENTLLMLKNKQNNAFILFNSKGEEIEFPQLNEDNSIFQCDMSTNDHFYCLDTKKSTLYYINLSEVNLRWTDFKLSSPIHLNDENKIESMKLLSPSLLMIEIRNKNNYENPISTFVYNIPLNIINEPNLQVTVAYKLENHLIVIPVELDGVVYLTYLTQILEKRKEKYKMGIIESTTGKELSYLSNTYILSKHHGCPVKMSVVLFRKKDNNLSFRLFLITEDHALHFWNQNGNVLWMREESLANIAATEMLDLPVSDTEAKMDEEFGHNKDNVLQKFVKRITTQLSQLKYWIQEQIKQSKLEEHYYENKEQSCSSDGYDCKSNAGMTEYMDHNMTDSQYNIGSTLRRDSFNVHKMLVLATTSGKIFGMESSTGKIVWRYLIKNARPFKKDRVHLFIQRTTAHFPHPPEALLIMSHEKDESLILHVFNPITGLPRGQTQILNNRLFLATMLSLPVTEENSYNKPVLILDRDLKVHIYPSTFQLSLQNHPIFLYRVDDELGHIFGYEVIRSRSGACADKKSNDHDCYVARQHWSLWFGSESQKISVIAFKSSVEQVHSVGRILADRNVLYKYLNPNLLAVMTESEPGSVSSVVTVYLVDMVTGKVIYSTVHKKAGGPVNLVQSENWIVYSFQNLKSHRTEIVVLELYEPYEIPESIMSEVKDIDIAQLRKSLKSTSKNDAIGGGFDILSILGGERATTKKFSSRQRSRIDTSVSTGMMYDSNNDRIEGNDVISNTDSSTSTNTVNGGLFSMSGPIVLKQAYIIGTFIRHAAVSITEKGITSKSILLSLESGGILELPKVQVDPRRSLMMSAELLEEGVEPYIPEIIIKPFNIINYNQSVSRVRNIYAGPSGLESTSLVFVYGLDLFFTQIAPSKMFDVLKEDFDHLFIGSVMIGMIVVAFLTQKLAARRALYRAWQ